MTVKILIGADPELFVKDISTGKYVSSHTFAPGTKKNPLRVDRGALQLDGTAFEFNIDPAETKTEFVSNIAKVKGEMEKVVRQSFPGHNGITLVADPVADYDAEYFSSIPGEALELGCEPDYNAYTQGPNPVPEVRSMFRTGSGHIHIGWTNKMDPFEDGHFQTCCEVVQQLDWYLGLPSLLWDSEGKRRRELYGKAGAFRPKSYGVEYRVLSNTWLRDERLIEFVFDNTTKAIRDMEAGNIAIDSWGQHARNVINKGEPDVRILKHASIPYPAFLEQNATETRRAKFG